MKSTLGPLAKAAVLIAVATWLGAIAQAATIIVTNTEDRGPGSLRAALAAANGTPARDLDVRAIQRELLRQGAYLSPAVVPAFAQVPSAAE